MKKKQHKFSETHIKHHKDGSNTHHYVHEDGPDQDVHTATADHDSMMDSMQDNLQPNGPEAEAAAPAAAPAPPPPVGAHAPAEGE